MRWPRVVTIAFVWIYCAVAITKLINKYHTIVYISVNLLQQVELYTSKKNARIKQFEDSDNRSTRIAEINGINSST